MEDLIYEGPALREADIAHLNLPLELLDHLRKVNGYVQYDGGFSIRGVGALPDWLNLESALSGEFAVHKLYPAVGIGDIPFGFDCLLDQFLLRDGEVLKLMGETGDVFSMEMSFNDFLVQVAADPVEFLALHPLIQLKMNGTNLVPGECIHVYPPFCTQEAKNGVSMTAVPIREGLSYLSTLSIQLAG